MIWHEHISIGIYESGSYTIRRETQCYTVWIKTPKDFSRIGRSSSLAGAKSDAEQHRAKHPV